MATATGAMLPAWDSPQPSWRQLSLRLAAGILLASQSLRLERWLVSLVNTLCQALVSAPQLAQALSNPSSASGWVAFLLTLVPFLALLLVLALIYAVRLAELALLGVAGPLAAVALLHPLGSVVTRAWAGELLAVTFLQLAQALLLVLFPVVATQLPSASNPALAAVASLALLYLTVRLPLWLRRLVHLGLDLTPLWRWVAPWVGGVFRG
jgi:hypothetical protein